MEGAVELLLAGAPEDLANGCLRFMDENQGVASWCVVLDGTCYLPERRAWISIPSLPAIVMRAESSAGAISLRRK